MMLRALPISACLFVLLSLFPVLTVPVLTVPGLTVTGSAAFAAPDIKVAYVDLQKALELSKAGKEAQKEYEAEVTKAQTSIDKKKTEFESLRKKFNTQRDSLNDSARAAKEEELIKLERDIKRRFKDSQEELRRKNAKIVGGLVRDLRKVVEEFGSQQGFTVILEKSAQAVLYADNSIDITKDVVERFNASKK